MTAPSAQGGDVRAAGSELDELLDEVRRIEVLSRRLVTDVMAGGYTSVFRGGGLEFESVREYEEGDDPRKVDWNVTARVGRPFVKTFVDERELTVLFVFDVSASTRGGFGIWSVRQTAARVCACLAFAAVRNNDKVGLVAASRGVDAFVPPGKGAGHALRIVRDCLVLRGPDDDARAARGSDVRGERSSTDLAPALEFVARALRRHAVVFVLSDFLGEGWELPLALCARRHDVVAVRMLAPELEPPDGGLMRVRDPESGVVRIVDWSSRRVRAAYRERVAAWRARSDDAFRRARVDCMDVPVPTVRDKDAISRPILSFFRMRASRGAKR